MVRVEGLVASPAVLFKINLVGAYNTPHMGAPPLQVAVAAVKMAVFLLQKPEAPVRPAGLPLLPPPDPRGAPRLSRTVSRRGCTSVRAG